jgi:hypothetical protein
MNPPAYDADVATMFVFRLYDSRSDGLGIHRLEMAFRKLADRTDSKNAQPPKAFGRAAISYPDQA